MGCCMDAVPVPAGAEGNPPDGSNDTRRPPSPRLGQTLNRLKAHTYGPGALLYVSID